MAIALDTPKPSAEAKGYNGAVSNLEDISMSDIVAHNQSDNLFESIKRFDREGNEYWLARELMPVLGYPRWERVPNVIDRAKASCQNAGNPVIEHFSEEARKLNPASPGRAKQDFRLSRLACYLVAMNGDPRKPEIAAAQSYFAAKTREAEVVIPAQQEKILQLQIELAEKQAIAAQSQLSLEQHRHLITATCPQPIRQEIFGYKVVEKTEYRDRTYKDDELLNDGSTISKTAIAKRWGFTSVNTKAFRLLWNSLDIPEDAWDTAIYVRENRQIKRDRLEEIDQLFRIATRQRYIGE